MVGSLAWIIIFTTVAKSQGQDIERQVIRAGTMGMVRYRWFWNDRISFRFWYCTD
jgi:hypothetical protein